MAVDRFSSGGVACSVMYFRFCGWRHAWPGIVDAERAYTEWITGTQYQLDTAAYIQSDLAKGSTGAGAKSDIDYCFNVDVKSDKEN